MKELGLDYSTAWGRRYRWRFARHLFYRFIMRPYIQWIGTLEVQGLEHLDRPGPFVFVANHTSHLDTALVLSALPPRLRERTVVAAAMDSFFMDRKTAFRTVFMFNAIPVDRHRVNRRSAQLALELLQDRWHILIYPEGGRTPDGQLQEFKGGAAYLADKTGATVVPIFINESGYLQGPRWAKAPQFANTTSQRRHHVSVTFGPLLMPFDGENNRLFGARIENAVAELGREVTRDPQYGRHSHTPPTENDSP